MPDASFDAHADDYNATVQRAISASGETVQFFADLKANLMRDALGPRRPGRILDFGCGIGNTTRAIAEKFPRASVIGMDLSEQSLAKARDTRIESGHPEYQQIEGASLPAPDQAFDVVFTACVFHHIEPSERDCWARELHRVLRPGGSVFLFEHNPRNPLTVRVVRRVPFDEGVVLLDGKEAVRRLASAGFRVWRPTYYFFFPAALRFLRRLEPSLRHVPWGGQYFVEGGRAG